MYGIVFDICSKYANIALLKDGKITQKFSEAADFGQADFVLPQINNLLEKEGIAIGDVSFISATTGPGSFAGLRAGIAIVKGLCIGLSELKVIGINCFEVYLSELKSLSPVNAVIIETKRDDFYVQLFDGKKQPITEPMNAYREDVLPMLKAKKVSVIGDGVERFLSVSTGLSFDNIVLSDGVELSSLANLAWKKFENKEFNFVKPLYIKDGVVKNESC